jgi:signal transduction histidine kinase/streptogramin lyase
MLIASGRAGAIWICTANQLSKLENGCLTIVCSDLPWREAFVSVRTVFEDSQGTVWIGTSRRGLYRLTQGAVIPVPIPYSSIKGIAEDREGNLWIATDGFGLLRLRRKAFLLFNTETGLGESRSSAVCEDSFGDVWLANRSGHLARVRDGIAESIPFTNEGRGIYTNSVCPDRDDHLWFGGPDGIFRISLRELQEPRKMSSSLTGLRLLFCAKNGDMWLHTYDGQFGYFRKDKYHEFPVVAGFSNGRIDADAMAEDTAGNLWTGGSSGELLRIADGHTTVYTVKDGLPGMPIHALYADAAGVLWIGTSAGLVLKQGERFRLFSEADGLPDFLIMQILEDDHGHLWFGSRRGLFYVLKEELLALARGKAGPLQVRTFNKDEGLTGISPVVGCEPSAWKAHDGRLWFATLAGVVALDPAAVPINRLPPPVFISEVYLDDQPLGAPAELRVPSGQHRLEFRFSALSFTAPEKVRLRHRLEGIDPGWVETNSTRSASYSSLPPGSHRLQVIACNDNGVWNDRGATLALIVVPPWWQTPWARTGALVLFTGLVIWTVRYGSQRKLQRRLQLLEYEHTLQQERVRIARDLHDELGGSLTQINLLAERIRQRPTPTELPGLLATLAGQARRITGELASIVWTISPKHNSLDQLASFIRQYALRFFRDTPVVCTVSGVESIPPCPLAPEEQHHLLSVAKEAMNNVLKHSHAVHLSIHMAIVDDVFELTLQDNGLGFDPADNVSHEGNGINNMRARVAEIGGRLQIVSRPNQGTRLSCCFPCARASIPQATKPA